MRDRGLRAPHVVARNSTTKFAWNAGGGVDFALGGWQSYTPQLITSVPRRVGFRF